jgi:hypothetical protein
MAKERAFQELVFRAHEGLHGAGDADVATADERSGEGSHDAGDL